MIKNSVQILLGSLEQSIENTIERIKKKIVYRATVS